MAPDGQACAQGGAALECGAIYTPRSAAHRVIMNGQTAAGHKFPKYGVDRPLSGHADVVGQGRHAPDDLVAMAWPIADRPENEQLAHAGVQHPAPVVPACILLSHIIFFSAQCPVKGSSLIDTLRVKVSWRYNCRQGISERLYPLRPARFDYRRSRLGHSEAS